MARKILIIISLLLLFTCCKQTKQITKTTTDKQTTIERTFNIEKDTIILFRQDTIFIRERNDTVYIEKIKYEYGYKANNKRDTIIKIDTIYKTEIKEKISEDKTKQARLKAQNIILIGIIAILIGVVIWQRWKRYIRN